MCWRIRKRIRGCIEGLVRESEAVLKEEDKRIGMIEDMEENQRLCRRRSIGE